MQAATALVDQERSQRTEAQGVSEQLKAESDRRARVFNNAVKAAVAKIQRDLEGERDAVLARHVHPPNLSSPWCRDLPPVLRLA